ncbi:hypothetical protein OAW23_05210 [Flavobacteriales bacterium]|nr:hypothetical protein [Flavobacteriales bacterium]MDC3337246.1 hypothetical protein [Flavobacteriales bacterium]
MPLQKKTRDLKEILSEIQNTGNILSPRSIDEKRGLYVQFLQNPHDDYYVRDSNDIQINEDTTAMGKPIIFPSCFAIKPGSHKKGWLHRRNIDFMHLIFCKVCPQDGVPYPEVGWASLTCVKRYYVWSLPEEEEVDLLFLEKRIWNPLVFDHFKTTTLTNEEILQKREELCLDGRLKNLGSTEWRNLRNSSQNYNDLFESLFIKLEEFVQQFEVEDMGNCHEGMSEDQKNRLIDKYVATL